MQTRVVGLTLVGLGMLSGCAGSKATSGTGGGAVEPAATADGGASNDAGSTTGGGVHANIFAVTVQSDSTSLCRGECAVLSAVALHSRGELNYQWNEGLGEGSEHEVCPEQTTRYEVTAQDLQAGTEFRQTLEATDYVTLDVRDCEADTGVMCEVHFRSRFPTTGNVFESNKPWLSLGYYDSAVHADRDGSVYFMGTFGQHLDLGAEVLEGSAKANGFVHKLGPDCEPLWTRRLDPASAEDTILASAMTTDGDGNVYVVSTAGPLVDFNPLIAWPFTFTTQLIVYEFSPAGDELLRASLPMGFGGFVNDVVTDRAGDLYVSGYAHAFTDFGGGPLGLSPTSYHAFLLALDERGRHRETHSNSLITRLERAGNSVVFIDNLVSYFDYLELLLGLFSPPNRPPALTSRGLPNLQQRWAHAFDSNDSFYPSHALGFADGTSLALTNVSQDEAQSTTTELHQARYEEDGDSTGPVYIPFLTGAKVEETEEQLALVPEVTRLAASLRDTDFAMAGMYDGVQTTALGNTLPSDRVYDPDVEWSGYYSDAFVASVRGDDTLAWVRRVDVGVAPDVAGLAMDANAHVWVAARSYTDNPPFSAGPEEESEQDIAIIKYRATQ